MVFRVVRVDHSGFCGREYHPQDSDVGLEVAVLRLDLAISNEDGTVDTEPVEYVGGEPARVSQGAVDLLFSEGPGLAGPIRVWTCVTRDGRFLELVEHEVELVSADFRH